MQLVMVVVSSLINKCNLDPVHYAWDLLWELNGCETLLCCFIVAAHPHCCYIQTALCGCFLSYFNHSFGHVTLYRSATLPSVWCRNCYEDMFNSLWIWLGMTHWIYHLPQSSITQWLGGWRVEPGHFFRACNLWFLHCCLCLCRPLGLPMPAGMGVVHITLHADYDLEHI